MTEGLEMEMVARALVPSGRGVGMMEKEVMVKSERELRPSGWREGKGSARSAGCDT